MPMALVDTMGYHAIIPGNHEFDDGWPAWLRRVDALKTPVLAANVSFDPRPDSPAADAIRPYIILRTERPQDRHRRPSYRGHPGNIQPRSRDQLQRRQKGIGSRHR